MAYITTPSPLLFKLLTPHLYRVSKKKNYTLKIIFFFFFYNLRPKYGYE